MTTISIPLPPSVVWALAGLGALVLLSAVVAVIDLIRRVMPRATGGAPVQSLKWLRTLAVFMMPIWAVLILAVLFSLIPTFVSILTITDAGDQRWHVLALVGLITALGGLLGAPLAVIRVFTTERQTRAQDEALFNDKINAASTDLSARRQVTRRVKGAGGSETVLTEWQDDLVTRAAAIDRLEGLAQERPAEAPRIARLLSIYVRELSRDHPAKTHPRQEWLALIEPEDIITPPMTEEEAGDHLEVASDDVNVEALSKWAHGLLAFRPDVERAAQTLGRLKSIPGTVPDDIPIDLRGANLQGFDLRGLCFDNAELQGARMEGANLLSAEMERADLNGARMEGASLWKARMEGANLSEARMEGANLILARMEGADLSSARMEETDLSWARMDETTSLAGATLRGAAVRRTNEATMAHFVPFRDDVFADGTATLPEEFPRPNHWEDKVLGVIDFYSRWRDWQATLSDPGG